MCGIAGVVSASTITEADVWRMVESIRYRGTDEQGVETLGDAVLGHARLAVVDPENGKQPMSNTDETVWVVFNGEIFNFVELRDELRAKGYQFKSRCDTEVLVHLWDDQREHMLSKLIGMFAFFIWDTKTSTGMLARDRQGIKPCFYARYRGGLAFASEMKAILALPNFDRQVNEVGLGNVFTFNYCPPPQTCFAGIFHLPPGHYMKFSAGGYGNPICYWKWPLSEPRQAVAIDDLLSVVDDAVRLQMRFDVDGGIFLSGGVDSSIVAHRLVPQWNREKLDALSIQLNERGFSEYEYAQKVAADLGVRLIGLQIQPEDIPAIAQNVVWHAEQPHGDFSFFLYYLMCRRAHEDGKVVMFTGDGPDEVMFGFRHNEKFFSEITRTNFPMRQYFDLISYSTAEERDRFISPAYRGYAEGAWDTFQSLLNPWSDLEPMEQISAYELTSLMPGNNSVKGDRMGACWSIEARAPFLDHRVSEMLARLPLREKYQDGVGKILVKNVAASVYGREFAYRPKTMPTLPIGEWLKGPLYNWARSVLESRDDGRFRKGALIDILNEHRDGIFNHTRLLRTILMTQLWLGRFFNE